MRGMWRGIEVKEGIDRQIAVRVSGDNVRFLTDARWERGKGARVNNWWLFQQHGTPLCNFDDSYAPCNYASRTSKQKFNN